MNDLAPDRTWRPRRAMDFPVRRALAFAGMAAAVGTATLLVLGVDCAIYLSLTGEPPSLDLVAQQATRWFCGLMRTCSS